MAHAVKLSEAFDLLDNGHKQKEGRSTRIGNDKHAESNRSSASAVIAVQAKKIGKGNRNSSSRPDPPCPFEFCKSHSLKHWIKDCPHSTVDEKNRMRAEIASEKAKTGPARSTRAQLGSKTMSFGNGSDSHKPTAGRLRTERPRVKLDPDPPSCTITLSDGRATLDAQGRCDDGSDDSIVSPTLAERAALKGIGKIRAIEPVRLQVALKSGSEAASFSFSRTWTSPRTVLHLSSGQLALANVTYLVADDDLACEDILIGLPVLRHLQVDTRTLLETNRSALDGIDCSDVGNPSLDERSGRVSRLMICRLNRVRNNYPSSQGDRPHVHYRAARTEDDPFPDPSLLDPVDSTQHDEVLEAIANMKHKAKRKGLTDEQSNTLDGIIDSHTNVFRTSFSSGPAAKFPPLKIDITADAKPVKVRLRNYSQDQREFLKELVDKLVRTGMAYPNPTSRWACAPLLVPKQGPTRFRFTVDLRPINTYTVKHQFPMPNLENELTKLGSSA